MDILQGLDWGNYVHWQHNQVLFVQEIMIRINQLGGYLFSVLVLVLALGWLLRCGCRQAVIRGLVFSGIGLVVVEGLRLFIGRPRPEVAEHWLGASVKSSPSFPSSTVFLATMAWGLLALSLGNFLRHNWQTWLLRCAGTAWIILLGFAPMFLGLHFLTDVLASWSLALVFLVCCRHSAILEKGGREVAS